MKKIGEATILLVANALSIHVFYWFYRRFTNCINLSSPFQKHCDHCSNAPLNLVFPYRYFPIQRTPGISLYYSNSRIVKNISETFLLNPYSLPRA